MWKFNISQGAPDWYLLEIVIHMENGSVLSPRLNIIIIPTYARRHLTQRCGTRHACPFNYGQPCRISGRRAPFWDEAWAYSHRAHPGIGRNDNWDVALVTWLSFFFLSSSYPHVCCLNKCSCATNCYLFLVKMIPQRMSIYKWCYGYDILNLKSKIGTPAVWVNSDGVLCDCKTVL